MLTRNDIEVRRITADQFSMEETWWAEDMTKWEFKLPTFVTARIHEAVRVRIMELYHKYHEFGFSGLCLGEYTEEFAWADVCVSNSLVHSIMVKPLEGRLEIWVHNRPEDPEDIVDSEHSEWKTGHSLQWIDVASFLKQFLTEPETVKW